MTDELTYTCERCGGTYRSNRSEQATLDEARELFDGITVDDDTGVLCEDCWQEFMTWMRATYGPPPWPVPAP